MDRAGNFETENRILWYNKKVHVYFLTDINKQDSVYLNVYSLTI